MRNQSGFTLIELIIVIIVLGILSAVAVPKFLDLQSDARVSALEGVKAALEGAESITYSKAAIEGVEKDLSGTIDDVSTVYGYPDALSLTDVVTLSDTDWTTVTTGSGITGTAYITAGVDDDSSNSGEESSCKLTYTNATDSDSKPVITIDDSDC